MMLNEDYELIFKIILIGDSGVGKTNILNQYVKQEFNQESKSTVGVEFGSKMVDLDGVKIKAQIWDTAGQEKYRSITNTYYKGSKGALIVYDITRKDSFDNVDKWYDDLKNAGEKDIKIILIGNKNDLESERNIKTSEGEKKATKLKIGFLETSAKNFDSVNKAFDEMIKKIYDEIKTKRDILNKDEDLDFENENNLKLSLTSEEREEKGSCSC